MPNKVYKVVKITDKIGFDKSGGVHDLIMGNSIVFTSPVEIGVRAWFEVEENGKTIATSTVKDFVMQGDNLKLLITSNTMYYLEAVEGE